MPDKTDKAKQYTENNSSSSKKGKHKDNGKEMDPGGWPVYKVEKPVLVCNINQNGISGSSGRVTTQPRDVNKRQDGKDYLNLNSFQ